MNKQKKYALRKIAGYGLVSCAVGFVLLGGSHVSADENTQPTSNTTTTVVEPSSNSIATPNEDNNPDVIHTVVDEQPVEEATAPTENTEVTPETEGMLVVKSSTRTESDTLATETTYKEATTESYKVSTEDSVEKTEVASSTTENTEEEAEKVASTPTENRQFIRIGSAFE